MSTGFGLRLVICGLVTCYLEAGACPGHLQFVFVNGRGAADEAQQKSLVQAHGVCCPFWD